MAVELVVGAAISASVEFLLEKIASSSFLRGKKDSGFDSLLERLKTTFICLSYVLGDAEQKQMRDHRVEEWLDNLQNVVEDVEDLFGEIEYDALKLKVKAESKTTKLQKFVSRFNLTDRKAAMKKLLERLDRFKEQIQTLGLQQHVEKIQSVKLPTVSSIDESEFFGRDEEMKSLKGMLLSDEIGREKICVIPIVGLGGIGKTTLAQVIYNDDQVSKYFELKAWVCVSDELDVRKVTKILYEGIAKNRDACVFENFDVVVEKIQEKLKKKKFLIILDDVWCEEHDFWDTMRKIFNVGAQGSKIIVTTRSIKVESIMGTTKFPHLNQLHEEGCLKLFEKIVSRREEFIADSDSKRIGKEIFKKCKGLPLAVKVVSSLLSTLDAKEWDKVVKDDVLNLEDGKTRILPALRLSYYYLPSHLKKCFVYCGLFPKDYLFEKDELVWLWMANGLLEPSSGIPNQTRREAGYGYFNDLVSRSFFQSHAGDLFLMHDLMVDLANLVSKKRFIYIERNKSCEIELSKKTRHIRFRFGGNSRDIFKLISLRTFFPIYPLENHLLKDWVKLKYLRFLSLRFFRSHELPESIGELSHLRFLDLTCTDVKELPESFCKLYNLETLKMEGCDLIELPKKFYHLINLRYLVIGCARLRELPPPLGQLPALETLNIRNCDAIEKVGKEFYGTTCTPFPSLETLKFYHMSNWKEWSVLEVNVEAFPKLKSLIIEKCGSLRGDLPYLLPSLLELRIFECPMLGSSLPMMPKVLQVRIENCDEVAGFKSNNLDKRCVPAKLRDLHISCCANIEFLPPHIYESLQELLIFESFSSFDFFQIDSFPNIKKLEIKCCESLGAFSQSHCPTLTQLRLSFCSKLMFLPDKLPDLLPSLQQLVIYNCPELESLPRCGLPKSLRELTIAGCDKLIASRNNWNLRALSDLIKFKFGDYKGEDMVSFLEQGSLPASLVSLEISNVDCLKTLEEKGFQELASLKELTIFGCPNLERLPVKGLPPSFEGSLPPSFERFVMFNCPELDGKYEWKQGDRGRKIYCIPRPEVPPSP